MKWEVQESWCDGIIYDIVDAETKEIICIADSDLRIANLISLAPVLLENIDRLVTCIEKDCSNLTERTATYISDLRKLINLTKEF